MGKFFRTEGYSTPPSYPKTLLTRITSFMLAIALIVVGAWVHIDGAFGLWAALRAIAVLFAQPRAQRVQLFPPDSTPTELNISTLTSDRAHLSRIACEYPIATNCPNAPEACFQAGHPTYKEFFHSSYHKAISLLQQGDRLNELFGLHLQIALEARQIFMSRNLHNHPQRYSRITQIRQCRPSHRMR